MTEEQKLDFEPRTEFQDDFILSLQNSLPTPRWDENVNSVHSPNRFCYAVFPEYSFERNDDVNLDLASEVEVDITSGAEPIPVNKLQQSIIAATDELQTSQQEEQPLDDNISNDMATNNDKQDSNTVNNLPELPQLSSDNYLADEEFYDTYQYLKDGTLTGDNERDRVVLLLLDQYFIENNALYRRTTPKNKKEKRINEYTERLCIPLSR